MHQHISTVEKGNHLEESFYAYLQQQQKENRLLYGIYPSDQCKLLRKKKYYCKEREGYVEFDIVLEVFRENTDKPHLFVVFECKNFTGTVPETEITDFSDKLSRLFKHNAKGVVVTSSGLQTGALNLHFNTVILKMSD